MKRLPSREPVWDLEFNEKGNLTAPASDAFLQEIAAENITDLFIFSHGWGTSETSARGLYDTMFPLIRDAANGVRGIVKWDRQDRTSKVHPVDSALQPDEAFFVPASKTGAEDDGYLLTYVYDRRTDRTELWILDASNLGSKPVATVKLPFRVPFGFHGLWVPA